MIWNMRDRLEAQYIEEFTKSESDKILARVAFRRMVKKIVIPIGCVSSLIVISFMILGIVFFATDDWITGLVLLSTAALSFGLLTLFISIYMRKDKTKKQLYQEYLKELDELKATRK